MIRFVNILFDFVHQPYVDVSVSRIVPEYVSTGLYIQDVYAMRYNCTVMQRMECWGGGREGRVDQLSVFGGWAMVCANLEKQPLRVVFESMEMQASDSNVVTLVFQVCRESAGSRYRS